MILERLLSIPAQQIETLTTESWAAYRRISRYQDVPALEPSVGLIGEALLDRTFTIATSVMVGLPLPEAVRHMLADLAEAREFYEERGWLESPGDYHEDPPPLEDFREFEEAAWDGPRRRRFRRIEFDSGWEPHPGEPGRERWLEHESNAVCQAYVLEHDEPRPWLVCVHGFGMGTPTVNFAGFNVELLHEKLGLNLIFPVLPKHGLRGEGSFSGGEILNPDFMAMVHLFAQAAWDVRRVVRWARERSGEKVGLYGISLGGYVSALTVSLEDDIDCVIAGIPAVDFANLARDNEPWIMRRYDDEFRMDNDLVRVASHVVSPLAMKPRIAREQCFIYAGIADRVVRPDQPRALWRHWNRPEIFWFSGGHVLGIFNRSIGSFLEESLDRAGMTASY